MADIRRLLLFLIIVLVAGLPLSGMQSAASDTGRYSDAEKAYVPLALTAKVSEAPRKALAVDPQGRIHIASSIMKREGGSVLAVLRVDEAGATVVPVTGAAVPYSEAENEPRDGAAGRAQFRWIVDMSFAPDGTLFLRDEHLIRKLDRSGQVTTWAF